MAAAVGVTQAAAAMEGAAAAMAEAAGAMEEAAEAMAQAAAGEGEAAHPNSPSCCFGQQCMQRMSARGLQCTSSSASTQGCRSTYR